MLKNSLSRIAIIILTLSLFLTGCGTQPATEQSQEPGNTPAATATSYPFVIQDDTGLDITIPAKPERIISFVPSATETLVALGLEESLVAVTQWDDYPDGIQQNVEYVFEDAYNPNTEQILKLNSDLIILGPHDDQTVQALRDLNLTVVKFDPQSLEATYRTIQSLGAITDTSAQADVLINSMKEKEVAVMEKVAGVSEADRVKVWIEVSEDLYTPGQNTFLNELVTKAGGVNIASSVEGWSQFSSEQVIEQNPQVILTTYGYYVPDAASKIKARPGWQTVDAVKNDRIVDLDSNLVSRPGPRIVDGMESIAKALYPELFQ